MRFLLLFPLLWLCQQSVLPTGTDDLGREHVTVAQTRFTVHFRETSGGRGEKISHCVGSRFWTDKGQR
jgi:hypothetical protein